MGYYAHHTIVVTSYDEDVINHAHNVAQAIFDKKQVSEVSEIQINGYRSFMVVPDGSKEGWEDSNLNDIRRHVFGEWIEDQAYPDGSNNLDYVEVRFGGDDPNHARIVKTTPKPHGGR